MTDFEHKSGRGGGKQQPLSGDPLLELTRLFGSRPRPISARVSYGGESQHTAGMESYGDAQGHLNFSQDEPQELEKEWYEDGDSALPSYYEADDGHDFAASAHETQWVEPATDPGWEEDQQEPSSLSASSWEPVGFEEEMPYEDSFQESGQHHQEVEHHHLAQGHGAGYSDALVPPPAFVSMMPPTSPAAPPSPAVQQPVSRKPKLQPSEISNVSFGYGHSVQIKPQTISAPRMPEAARMTPHVKNDAPPRHASATAPQPASSISPEQGSLNEALHDFDLTIPRDKQHSRRVRSHPKMAVEPSVGAVKIAPHHIEETGNFDLPPVPYGTQEERVGEISPHQATLMSSRPSPVLPSTREAMSPPPLPKGNPDQAAAYDWGGAKEEVVAPKKKRKKSRKLYGFIVVFLLFAMGAGGYWLFEYYERNGSYPVIINADPDDVRIIPQQAEESQTGASDSTVYGGATAEGEQGGLLDGRETPLNLDQMNEQPPFSNESSLEPRSIENSILQALSRTIPIHLVPTIIMRRDEGGNLVNVSQNNNAPEMVIRPGADYRASIVNARSLQEQRQEVAATDIAPPTGQPVRDISATLPEEVPDSTSHAQAGDVPEETRLLSDVDDYDTGQVYLNNGGGNLVAETVQASNGEALNVPPTGTSVNSSTLADRLPVLSPQNSDISSFSSQTTSVAEGESDFYVQIASQPTQAAAQQSANEAKSRFAAIIGDRRVSIVPADIPGRGIYYRVRVATGGREAALNLCEQYKQAGGSCFIGH